MVVVRLWNAWEWNGSKSCLPSLATDRTLSGGMIVCMDPQQDRSSVVPFVCTRISETVPFSGSSRWTCGCSRHSGCQMDWGAADLLWSGSARGEGHHQGQERHMWHYCTCRYCEGVWQPFGGMLEGAFSVLISRTWDRRSSSGSGPKIRGLWPVQCVWGALRQRFEDDWWQ